MDEIEDVETTTVTGLSPLSTSLAVEQQREAGLNALARISDAEFVERLKSLRLGLDRFDMMMREVLTTGSGPGYDLMVIEGVDKPVFTQSAAEKTCFVARLCPEFTVDRTLGTPPDSPVISYTVRCNLHLGNLDGPVVAQGVGSANSHEKKYRWRYAEKHCPECGVVGGLLRSKHKAKPGTKFAGSLPWFCWKKKGGCGTEFAEDDDRITTQTLGMVENPDPFDLDNTLLKIAKKRAHVDATKTATCASGRVTQDMEEGHAGSEDATVLRDRVLDRARKLGWTTLGPVLDAVRRATGKPVRTKVDFDRVNANDLARTLEKMPLPPDEKQEDDSNLSLGPDGGFDREGANMDDEPSGGPA